MRPVEPVIGEDEEEEEVVGTVAGQEWAEVVVAVVVVGEGGSEIEVAEVVEDAVVEVDQVGCGVGQEVAKYRTSKPSTCFSVNSLLGDKDDKRETRCIIHCCSLRVDRSSHCFSPGSSTCSIEALLAGVEARKDSNLQHIIA